MVTSGTGKSTENVSGIEGEADDEKLVMYPARPQLQIVHEFPFRSWRGIETELSSKRVFVTRRIGSRCSKKRRA
uniref:Uncharacterized protein n=1 Tax=Physcomitrium patens TaxID=3218 RepID=A0A2K1JZ96_PHYPA|nr:hypothetical protein PHYPA_013960 [Physcomitrium patens]